MAQKLSVVENEDRDSARATRMFVTPQLAADWLKRNPRNRRVSPSTIARYAEDIRAGRWQLNGETIVMGADGDIIDGQHRLMAIVEAGREIETFVAHGVAPEAFHTIDQGKSRTAADVLTMAGYTDAQALSALARLWVIWERTGSVYEKDRAVVPSTQEILTACDVHSDTMYLAMQATHRHRKLFGSTAPFAFSWYWLGQIDETDRNEFFARLADGDGLKEGDAIFALRRVLLLSRLENRKQSRNMIFALLVKAWNKWRQHEVTLVLQFRGVEDWPTPV